MPAMTSGENGRLAVYEIAYIFIPALAEDSVASRANALKDALTAQGGEIIAEEAPALRPLAYDMAKVIGNKRQIFRDGFFGWVKFKIERDVVQALEKTLRSQEDIIRFLLVETVRENTLLSRRSAVKQEGARGASAEAPEKLSEAEIDRTVEALVKE